MSRKVALYSRISQEDKQAGESASICAQRALLRSFVETSEAFFGWEIAEFIDDGYSGMDFLRPGMQQMLAQIACGEIGCVIVKDLSRFGRAYIEAGYWIEQVFAHGGVRLIAVSEGWDSTAQAGAFSGALQNIIHTLYSRDLSLKVSSARRVQMEQGVFTSVTAPFGYRKCEQTRGRLEIAPEAAAVVREIFVQAGMGTGAASIAQLFNRRGVLTPLAFQRRETGGLLPQNVWTDSAVRRILRDERYCGVGVFGKRKRSCSRATEKIARAEWVRIPDAHPAIVSATLFEQVQDALRPLQERSQGVRGAIGWVKCGHCGYTMRRKNTETPYYFCDTGRQTDAVCTGLQAACEIVETPVYTLLALLAQLGFGEMAQKQMETKQKELLRERAKQDKEMRRVQRREKDARCHLYEQWKAGERTQQDYLEACARIGESSSPKKSKLDEKEQQLAVYEQLFSKGVLSGGLEIALRKKWIKHILFYQNNQISIVLNISLLKEQKNSCR